MVVPICAECDRFSCENHSGFALLCIASKPLAGIILRESTIIQERCMGEIQSGFRPDWVLIGQIFTDLRTQAHVP